MNSTTKIELDGVRDGVRAPVVQIITADHNGGQLTTISILYKTEGNVAKSVSGILGDQERSALIKALAAIKESK